MKDYKARKMGMPIEPIEDRIKNLVKINKSGCWEWQGQKNVQGYGRLVIGSRKDGSRKSVFAHRLSYTVFKGMIPEGMFVCHLCDNPCCVNPNHLFCGSRQDNTDDRELKGRNNHVIGENVGTSKLTANEVFAARKERQEKGTTYQKLADKYGVNKKTMMFAIKGETWKHLPPPPTTKE